MKIFKPNKLPNWLFLIGFVLLCAVGINLASSKKASAFSTTTQIQSSAPNTDSANIYGSGTNMQPWFAVGVGAYDGPVSYAKVYVPAGGSATLTVQQGYGVCGIDVGSPNVDYNVWTLNSTEGFSGSGGQSKGSANNMNQGCGSSVQFTLTGGTAATGLVGHGAYDVYYFEAQINGGVGDNEKNFRLSVSNGKIGVARPVKFYGAKPWFGIYMRDAPQRGGNNWDYAVQAAPFCNEDTGTASKSIAVHDIDYGVYPQPNLEGLVDRDIRDNPSFNWGLAPPGEPSSKKVAGEWPSGTGTDSSLDFDYDNNYRYLLEFRDIEWHNTIQISLPFDQFDAQASVGTACKQTGPPVGLADGATCDAGPARNLPASAAGSTQNVNIAATNVGTSTWTTSYSMKRTSGSKSLGTLPSQVKPGGAHTFTDSFAAPQAGSSFTVTYQMFNANNNSFGQLCTLNISVAAPPGVTSCTATARDKFGVKTNQYPIWDGVTPSTQAASQPNIRLQVHNGETYTFPGGTNGYTIRQVAYGTSPKGGQRYLPVGGIAPKKTSLIQPDITLAARTAPTTITFWYALFTGDTGGDPRVPGVDFPLCPVTITWYKGAPPNCTVTGTCPTGYSGRLDVACGSTQVAGVYVPATRQTTTSTGTLSQPKLITQVATRIHVRDNDDGREWDFNFEGPGGVAVPNGTSLSDTRDAQGVSTFGLGQQAGQTMWPQHTYTLTLYFEGRDGGNSTSYPDNGSHGYYGEGGGSVFEATTPGNCLTASCNGGSSPDVEPGQNATLTGSIHFDNQTQETYGSADSNGYGISVDTNGGLGGAPGAPIGTNGPISPGGSDPGFSFTTNIDYQGSYSWTLTFQGNSISFGQDVPCNGPTITPATRPFFQVWGGDVNTGGGFAIKKADGSYECSPTSDYPDYVSPASNNLPAGKRARDFGGIKAFGAPDGSYGSLADFGALSLGEIAKDANHWINFGAQPSLSNTASPYYGQLNSRSPNYCIPDFFDQTQDNPNTIGPVGDLNASMPTNGQYYVNSPISDFGGGHDNHIVANSNRVLYVNGDVTITGNIYYGGWNVDSDSPPSFTLIVRGNINIDANVKHLDGLYIAQPIASGAKGEFNTCADNTGNQFCVQQLIINGAVIAREIKPLRSVGTLAPDANPNFSPPPGHNAAEVFNFVPSMVMTSPVFAPTHNNLQGYFNLPPVF
jgi:hypothetical protein